MLQYVVHQINPETPSSISVDFLLAMRSALCKGTIASEGGAHILWTNHTAMIPIAAHSPSYLAGLELL
eukprot:453480-Hanusia_phi.AAC.2